MSTSAKTERLNLLVTPVEKAALEAKAQKAGLTVSELLRRSAADYEPSVGADDLRSVLRALAEMADRLVPEIDAAFERMREREREAGTEAEARERALADIQASDTRWPFAVPAT